MAQALKRGVLSKEDCITAAIEKLHFEEDAVDAALQYLDQVSAILYYPKILPNVVFANPQIVLDKISELVFESVAPSKMISSGEWRKFCEHALVTEKFLSDDTFSSHYVSGLFEVNHLIMLFKKLLIFATFSKSEYFVPALLRHLDKNVLDDHRIWYIPSLVLQFPGGGPRQGIFCALLCWLVSHENNFPAPWSISVDELGSPVCLYRNCVQFDVPDLVAKVTLIDTYTHFEVHIDIPPEDADDLCPEEFPVIRKAIAKGLHKSALNLGYFDSSPSSALLCPCGRGEAHVAEIIAKCTRWKCTLKGMSVKVAELTQLQQLLLDECVNTVNPISQFSSSPGGLMIDHISPSTAKLSWTPVPKEQQIGVIAGYTVQVKEPDSGSTQEIPVEEADATSVEIFNLNPFTLYHFSISAKTKLGYGPAATISSRTPETAKMIVKEVSVKQEAPTTPTSLRSLIPKEAKELSGIGPDEKQALKMFKDLESGESRTPIDTTQVISNLKLFSDKAIDYVKSEIDSIVSQHRDEVQGLQEEIATLSKEKKQLFQQLDQEPKSKWESALLGVDVHGETSLTVTTKAQQFIWKMFGLKLTIPSGALPPGVEQCELLIKASLSGHYQLPRNHHLVSPIFWIRCEPHCKSFAKTVTLEIEHCALNRNLSKLSFVRALCTQKELPYSFKAISGGKFSERSSYGLIELNSFSGVGTSQKGSEEREYCASLFYRISAREIHFTITWNTDAHRNVTEKRYASLNATPGPDQEIEFEADAITLDIPERGGVTEGSWKILPLFKPQVTKKQVDSFKEGKRIPHCSLKVSKLSNQGETKTEYYMNLLGTKNNSFFLITLGEGEWSENTSQSFGSYEERHFTYLMSRLKDHASEWKFLGCCLGFSQGQLKNIESNPMLLAKAPVSFLSELLTRWLQRGSATLESLKSALNQADLGVVAHEIVIP